MFFYTPTRTMCGKFSPSIKEENIPQLFILRSALDEAREINHHGMSVKVGENDNEDGAGTEAYDKDLVSRDEKRQDQALR